MTLRSERELLNARIKLAWLEQRRDAMRQEVGGDEHVRELSLESLARLIKQFKEEIIRYEIKSPSPTQ